MLSYHPWLVATVLDLAALDPCCCTWGLLTCCLCTTCGRLIRISNPSQTYCIRICISARSPGDLCPHSSLSSTSGWRQTWSLYKAERSSLFSLFLLCASLPVAFQRVQPWPYLRPLQRAFTIRYLDSTSEMLIEWVQRGDLGNRYFLDAAQGIVTRSLGRVTG